MMCSDMLVTADIIIHVPQRLWSLLLSFLVKHPVSYNLNSYTWKIKLGLTSWRDVFQTFGGKKNCLIRIVLKNKIAMVVHVCNANIWNVKAGELGVYAHS